MAIDGSVWIGTTNGKILRFTQGKENTLLPKGVEPAFGSALTVYVSDREINVYVLDKENSRVVVLDKEGMYLSQYRFEGNIAPTAFAVSEKERKIFLVSGGKIYAMDLK
jgi:DNA-binding beta-propeller fold protein YncE